MSETANADIIQVAVIVACGGRGARFRSGAGGSSEVGSSEAGSGAIGAGAVGSNEVGSNEVGSGAAGSNAAGVGDEGVPEKQFCEIAGKPVLSYTLDTLERHPRIAKVVLVLPMEALGRGEALVKGQWGAAARAGAVSGPGADRHADSGDLDNPVPGPYRKVSDIVAGGNDRQESVANGLAALAASGWRGPVLVHDGVRPLASARVYDRVIEGTVSRGNAVAAIPLRDTIKRADGNRVVSQTLPREGLWQIQTPQGFWIDQLIDAYDEGKKRGLKVTDDASLLEALGYKVHLVDGDPINIKMTYKEDMEILKALLI